MDNLGITQKFAILQHMKDYLKSVATQLTAIILAGLAAGAVAFFQSVASQAGVCNAPTMSPEEVGALGAIFKTMHSAVVWKSATLTA